MKVTTMSQGVAVVALLTAFVFAGTAGAQSNVPGIWLMDADGGNAKLLVKMPEHRWHGSPSWSADGKFVYFDATTARSGPARIYRIPAGNGAMDAKPEDLGPGRVPSVSPDGKKIAFYFSERDPEFKRGVWVANANGTQRMWLSEGVRPKWSPDGKSLAFSSSHEGEPSLYVMQDGKRRRVLHQAYSRIIGATWSPDGKRLAFIGQRGGESELAIVNVDGDKDSFRVRLRGRIGWVPSWSPDGKAIVFWQKQEDDSYRLYTINPETDDDPVLLKEQNGRFNSDPCWSPDGKRIAFTRNREE